MPNSFAYHIEKIIKFRFTSRYPCFIYEGLATYIEGGKKLQSRWHKFKRTLGNWNLSQPGCSKSHSERNDFMEGTKWLYVEWHCESYPSKG